MKASKIDTALCFPRPIWVVHFEAFEAINEALRREFEAVDWDALAAHRPEILHDLPAGGRRLVQRASGYVATVVSGEVTHEDGKPTGALPGKLVRGAQAQPS